MLAAVDPRLLDRVRFPLGEQTKAETRAEAAAAGLVAAGRAESQEACFLGGDDYRAFLERRGVRGAKGEVVDADGARLGSHDGHWRFTPGQRRGLQLSASRPLYVLRTEAATQHGRRRVARRARDDESGGVRASLPRRCARARRSSGTARRPSLPR